MGTPMKSKILTREYCLGLTRYTHASDAVKVAFASELPITLPEREYKNRVRSLTCTLHRYFDGFRLRWPWVRKGRPRKWG